MFPYANELEWSPEYALVYLKPGKILGIGRVGYIQIKSTKIINMPHESQKCLGVSPIILQREICNRWSIEA